MPSQRFRVFALVALALICLRPGAARAQATGTTRLASAMADDDTVRVTAISKLESFVQRYPDSQRRANALFELGELLVRQADDAFAAAQRGGGASVPVHPDYRAAIDRYAELVSRYPQFPRVDAAAYTLGTLYFADAQFANAARMFELVTSRSQSAYRAESFFRLGDARFELASQEREAARKGMFVQAAQAYDSAARTAPAGSDIHLLALYKLGWSYYSQATRPEQPEYRQAVDVFGQLATEYDQLSPERRARLGLRSEALEYMAVALTQVGGAPAADQYFATHSDASFRLPVMRRVAASLRDQGDFPKAVAAYAAVEQLAPTDSGALAAQREIVDIYQNRMLDPVQAQQARLVLVNTFAPESAWAKANPELADTVKVVREQALRHSAQYELSLAQGKQQDRSHFNAAAELYGRYLGEFPQSDSVQSVAFFSGEALFGMGDYAHAAQAYTLAAYGRKGDDKLAAQAGQNAIVAYDSALVHNRGDRAAQDSLFGAVDRFVAAFPGNDAATKALIEKGKRASEAQRWDVMEKTFRTYAERYPNDPYTPTAQKLVGDAMYREGRYVEAQGQWEQAQTQAAQSGKSKLADSIRTIRDAAAVTFGDSLVKAGDYRRAAEEVYVAFADRNPTSDRAPDALRNAVETYMLADSAARAHNDTAAAQKAKTRALELSSRLVKDYPKYKYRVQYQALGAQLLADLGRRDEAVQALDALVQENPTWSGRADAMVRRAVMLDSLGKHEDAASAYEAFATAYPKDRRAADAQFNAAVTYLEAPDSAAAARAYGTFATRFPRDSRAGQAQQMRVALLKASGDITTVNTELARLCQHPSAALRADCAERKGESEFRLGAGLFSRYKAMQLVIPSVGNLTRRGVDRLSKPKRDLLRTMSDHFTASIATGAPEWLAASSYYVGLAQWEYGNFLKNVTLPRSLTADQRAAAQTGSAQQAEQYYTAAKKTWQTLLDKAAKDSITNAWVDRARAALAGTVDESPPTSFRDDPHAARVGGER